jgi:hypothetical protein
MMAKNMYVYIHSGFQRTTHAISEILRAVRIQNHHEQVSLNIFLKSIFLWLLHEISKRKANWIGHILRRNCLLQRVIGGKIKGGIEVTGRRGRRRRKVLDDLEERGGYYYLKEEALDRTVWSARFGRGFGPVVRQTAK